MFQIDIFSFGKVKARYVQFLDDDTDQNRDRPILLRQLTDFDRQRNT
jgi:hypothetical protein